MGRRQTVTAQDILARARLVFLRHGMQASTRDIASAVGLTWGALAFRFGSKRRLFEQAMAERDDAASSLAVSLMKRVVQAMADDIDGRLRAHGLTLAQRKALVVLGQGRAVTPSEVSLALDLDAGATTRLLDRLLAKRLCLGRRDEGEHRCVRLQITELGRSALEGTEGMDMSLLRDWFAPAREGELGVLCSLLSTLLAARRRALACRNSGAESIPVGDDFHAGAVNTAGMTTESTGELAAHRRGSGGGRRCRPTDALASNFEGRVVVSKPLHQGPHHE